MGAWGMGIFSNDTACDVRDMYLDFLAYGYDDLKAEGAVIEYWAPQVGGTEEEPNFWFALAATEHKYGRLSDKVHERALYYVEHNEDDLILWSGAQKRKRHDILKKLEATLSLPAKRKRVPPLRAHSTGWKRGDIVLARLAEENMEEVFAMQVFDIVNMPCSSFIPDGPQNQIPVIGVYRWTGRSIPDVHELVRHGFIERQNSTDDANPVPYVFCFLATERERKKYGCVVVDISAKSA